MAETLSTPAALPTRFVVTISNGDAWQIVAELGEVLTDAGRATARAIRDAYLYKRSVRICTVDASGNLKIG